MKGKKKNPSWIQEIPIQFSTWCLCLLKSNPLFSYDLLMMSVEIFAFTLINTHTNLSGYISNLQDLRKASLRSEITENRKKTWMISLETNGWIAKCVMCWEKVPPIPQIELIAHVHADWILYNMHFTEWRNLQNWKFYLEKTILKYLEESHTIIHNMSF